MKTWVVNTKARTECTNSISKTNECARDALVSALTLGANNIEDRGNRYRLNCTIIFKTTMKDKQILYILLLLTLTFTALMTLWILFSDEKLEEPWIDPDSRVVLESLDKKLVFVLDQLFAKKPLDIPRIERRLYLFPFMVYHNRKKHAHVLGIVRRISHRLHPNKNQQRLEFEWASNRDFTLKNLS